MRKILIAVLTFVLAAHVFAEGAKLEYRYKEFVVIFAEKSARCERIGYWCFFSCPSLPHATSTSPDNKRTRRSRYT